MKYYFLLFFILSINLTAQTKVIIDKLDCMIDNKLQEKIPQNITTLLQTKEKGEFNFNTINQDLTRLLETKKYRKAAITVIEENKEGVHLRFILEKYALVEDILFFGNVNMKENELLEKITLEKGKTYSHSKLAQSKKAILELYVKDDFINAQVTTKIEKSGRNKVNIVFSIQENARLQVDKISFVGNKSFDDDTLIDLMETYVSMWRFMLDRGFLDKGILEEDLKKVIKFYQNRGYLDVKILNTKQEVVEDDNQYVHITITLSEGNRYKLGTIAIENNTLFSTAELKEKMKLQKGDFFLNKEFLQDLYSISDRYQHLGHLNCRVIPKLTLNPTTRVVDVVFKITEGTKSYIRDINILGNTVTKEHVIMREFAIHPDDLANQNKIALTKRRLLNLNYFSDVKIAIKDTQNDQFKDLEIKLKEKATGSVRFGVAFSDADNILGQVSLTENNFDLFGNWPYSGGGQKFNLNLQAGSTRTNFSLNFVEPWLYNEKIRFGTSLYHQSYNYDDYDQQNTGINLYLTSKVYKTNSWTRQLGLKIEKVTIDNFYTGASSTLQALESDDLIVGLYFSYKRDTRNGFLRPTDGSLFSIYGEMQPSFLGSSHDNYILKVEGKKYYKLNDKNWVFRMRGKAQVVDDLNDKTIGLYNRFFLGGLSSVRGFRYRTISPLDSNLHEIGGNSALSASAEIDIPLSKQIDFVTFVDVGNVWSKSYNFDLTDLNVTSGIGLRINTGALGRMIFDYGFPIIDNQDNVSAGRFHFSIGAGF